MTATPYRIVLPHEIPADLAPGDPLPRREYLLDGELRVWEGPMDEILSPIVTDLGHGPERTRLGSCPAHDADAGLAALAAARGAYDDGLGDWPTRTVEARMACVADFARRMAERRAEIVRLMVWEICKSRAQSEQEFDRTIEYIDDTLATLRAMRDPARRNVEASGLAAVLDRSPLGVVLCMGPFNFPLNETLATLIPALVMGNTTVVKLPRIGRLLFWPLMRCFAESFPRGVVNVVSGGMELARPLMSSGHVDVLAFIGTSRAAEALRALHPRPNRLRCVLGMEAKNAAIILPDADLATTVPEVLRGAFGFNGQRCTAIKLIFAARSIAQPFLEQFANAASALKIGMPWEDGVNITPLPEPGKTAFLDALLADARERGADVVDIPGRPAGALDEAFFAPTIVSPVTPAMRAFREEQFGPLAPVAVFDDAEGADGPLRAIARSDYGQQASLFGGDPAELSRLAARLRNLVSRVNINCKCQRGPDILPFTARRDSAVGTLSVADGLRAFSLPTLTVARQNAANAKIIAALKHEEGA